MRFLQLTRKFPYPPIDGESLNLSNFNRLLVEKGHSLDLLSFNTIKHYFDIQKLPQQHNYYNTINDIYLDNRVKVKDAFINLFSSSPYHITRFISKEFEQKLIDILSNNKYDFILVESLNLVPYLSIIRKYSKAKIILRAHNVEYEIWERITSNTKNLIKRFYTKYLTKKLKKYELEEVNHFDILLTVTSRDLSIYRKNGFKGKGIVVPAGISSTGYKPTPIKGTKPLELSFLGSLDWMPNIEGVNWFLDNCWQDILIKAPETKLHIAGRNTPNSIFALRNNNITIHGEVENAIDFLNSYPVMIVPLLSGGGMRLKILEALALGRVIITTSIGLEGIDAVDNKDVLIADTPKEFIEKVLFCIDNEKKMKEISANAIKLFHDKYNLGISVDLFLSQIIK